MTKIDNSNGISYNVNEIKKIDDYVEYNIVLKIPIRLGWIDNVFLIMEKDNKYMKFPFKYVDIIDDMACFNAVVDLKTWAIYHYAFSCYIEGKRYCIDKDGILCNSEISKENMGKLSVNFSVPDWAKGKMMYHIFVDRFFRGSKKDLEEMPRRYIHKSWNEDVIVGPDKNGIWNNDFFGGDLKGIIDKLDYIESLGVSILYLSPVVYSQSTHRYDASDYENVDPYAGSNEDLKILCDEAHKRDMKVVLDAVFNHTGSDSKYFNIYRNQEWEKTEGVGASHSNNSKYSDFYRKVFNPQTGNTDFSYWWGHTNLPECDGESLSWQNYIVGQGGIIDQWFELGIDGLRLDVADNLTDEFIEKIRVAVKRNKKDGLIMGEVWENPILKDNRKYLKTGLGMDTAMNYYFIGPLVKYFRDGDVTSLASRIKEIQTLYPKDTINSLMNFTSTHDMTRAINLWDKKIFIDSVDRPWNLINEDYELAKNYFLDIDKYKHNKEIYMAYVFCLTFMPGILSIFYGDEVGLQGIGNLSCRRTFPWGKEDMELLDFFRYIGRIRSNEEMLEDADLRIYNININWIAFERIKDNKNMLIVVNRTDQEQKIVLPSKYTESDIVYTLKKSKKDELSPYGGIVYKK